MVEIIVSVVIEVAKCLAPSTERQLSYVRDYKSNFDNLKTQIKKLEGEIVSMQHAVDVAKSKGEEIEQNVQNWLADANTAIVEAKNFVGGEATPNNRCFMGLCPNLKIRRRLSQEAVRQLDAMVKLGEDGRFERISYSIIPEDTLLLPNRDYEAFESRMSILNEIIDALKNPDINMLGIYGMGGIGKTTLAKEVAGKAKNDKLFDQVVFSEVSESQDIRKIQDEIADKVGLEFKEKSKSGRASRLYDRLKKEKRILVISDNIWKNLDLKVVGIPHGDDHKGCKVLLTARSLDTLREMDSQQNFLIGALGEEEAWSLFKKMAGNYVEGSELQRVARDVANECAGLPVSIVTVARALRNKKLFEWTDALEQLKRPCSMNFKDVQLAAYNAIKLSYEKLEGDELKSTFLLIGYTAISSIDGLLMYGMGLGLFQGVNKMKVARDRVHTLVNKLKDSCLLLDDITSGDEEYFSIHDVVRDVAISIAFTERNMLSATNEQVDGCGEYWSDENAVRLSSIVLRDIKTNVLPDHVLECPQLKLFSIRSADSYFSSLTISNNFFERMIQVRVIECVKMNLPSLPSSLGLLKNLRTLILFDCNLLDVSVIGDLKKLEILCLRDSNIRHLPVEVGELTRLRLLDLRCCWNLKVIPQNVLSNLSLLEELYIGDDSFTGWEVEVEGHKNASLDELKHLHNLTSLELEIGYENPPPRGLFFEKLERYIIRMGRGVEYAKTNIYRSLILGLEDNISLEDALIVQLQRIEHLELLGLQERDLRHFVNELARVGSSQLKHLHMEGLWFHLRRYSQGLEELEDHKGLNEIVLENDVNGFNTLFTEKVSVPKLETLYLSLINIERIWENQVAAMSCGIQNLTHLTVSGCRNLKCLFPSSSVINSLVRFQHLEICSCPVLEEIIIIDQEESKKDIVMFPQLRSLKMQYLEKLTSFCMGDAHSIEFPSLEELEIIGNPDQFMVKLKSTTCDLTKKRQEEEESTNDMESYEIIMKDSVNTSDAFFIEKVSLPKLETLDLHSMNIERIWQNKVAAMSCGIQNLTYLTIGDCRSLRWVISSSMVSCFARLQHLEIYECPGLEEVIVMDDEKEVSKNNENTVTFPQLQSLRMNDLERLTSFSTGEVHLIEFPSLKELEIISCPNQFMVNFKHHLTKMVFPNLEELKVDAKYIKTNKCLFSEDLLCNLKRLDVEFVDESPTVLSFDDFLQRFHTLKVLQIGDCWVEENVENGTEVIIREANNCCDLRHILKKDSSSVMNNLVVLRVAKCHHLINLVPSSTSFQNLTTLAVWRCEGLKNVFTSSIAKTLVQLRQMEIRSCDMITEIVVADDDVAAKDEVIAFSELNELELVGLKNLTSFCSGNCAFKFPSLETLMVDDCPSMTIFSRGESSTPKLDRVQLYDWSDEYWIWEHDLNTTIQQIHRKNGTEEEYDNEVKNEEEDAQGSSDN